MREYRTYAHIAASYGIAESNLYRTVKWVEDTLVKDGAFSLPGIFTEYIFGCKGW
ncbi:hypothetical protein FACS1894208_12350 [Clostridia bacterium]|nr:hypothetical protein FACS1894208_12350 [Clostridia bacterium]